MVAPNRAATEISWGSACLFENLQGELSMVHFVTVCRALRRPEQTGLNAVGTSLEH